MKTHHDHKNFYEGKNSQLKLDYNFSVLIHYNHGRIDSDILVGMVMEKQLRVLHLDLQKTGSELSTTL